MSICGLVSGGKDSIFNLFVAKRLGYNITFNELDSYMFQSVGSLGVVTQSSCMNTPLLRKIIQGKSLNIGEDYDETCGDEIEDLYSLLLDVKNRFPEVKYVSTGAIASDYQRIRVEHVCHRLELENVAFLWHIPQPILLHWMIDSGLDARLIKVAAFGLTSQRFLGRTLKESFSQLLDLKKQFEVNVCGEGGEYETFVCDCPTIFNTAKVSIDWTTHFQSHSQPNVAGMELLASIRDLSIIHPETTLLPILSSAEYSEQFGFTKQIENDRGALDSVGHIEFNSIPPIQLTSTSPMSNINATISPTLPQFGLPPVSLCHPPSVQSLVLNEKTNKFQTSQSPFETLRLSINLAADDDIQTSLPSQIVDGLNQLQANTPKDHVLTHIQVSLPIPTHNQIDSFKTALHHSLVSSLSLPSLPSLQILFSCRSESIDFVAHTQHKQYQFSPKHIESITFTLQPFRHPISQTTTSSLIQRFSSLTLLESHSLPPFISPPFYSTHAKIVEAALSSLDLKSIPSHAPPLPDQLCSSLASFLRFSTESQSAENLLSSQMLIVLHHTGRDNLPFSQINDSIQTQLWTISCERSANDWMCSHPSDDYFGQHSSDQDSLSEEEMEERTEHVESLLSTFRGLSLPPILLTQIQSDTTSLLSVDPIGLDEKETVNRIKKAKWEEQNREEETEEEAPDQSPQFRLSAVPTSLRRENMAFSTSPSDSTVHIRLHSSFFRSLAMSGVVDIPLEHFTAMSDPTTIISTFLTNAFLLIQHASEISNIPSESLCSLNLFLSRPHFTLSPSEIRDLTQIIELSFHAILTIIQADSLSTSLSPEGSVLALTFMAARNTA
ncbi:putative Diphthine--ammonia ligase [Blattamonas nauphoetae]|uniref:Diphthine--ammonia ligase n=1 Tax=Blattamonas nauphoetae TaxID=2049346 RepID=A0ABQ9XLU8_9EUKA|nr:putative Diphthine--ammonia ligase [Blattamonas nauphoetae]